MVKLKKAKASTLVEAIVAMVIITAVFFIAMLILTNITARNNPMLRFRAYSEALNTISNSLATGDFDNEEWQLEGLYVEKQILPYKEYKDLRILEVKVTDIRNQILVERKELVIIPE